MFEFDPAPPTRTQRIIAAVITLAVIVPTTSEWANLRWFNGYDKQVAAIATILGVIWFVKFAPGVKRKDGHGR